MFVVADQGSASGCTLVRGSCPIMSRKGLDATTFRNILRAWGWSALVFILIMFGILLWWPDAPLWIAYPLAVIPPVCVAGIFWRRDTRRRNPRR